MADENPLERMLNQLADLFKLVDENKTKPLNERVTPEIRARLDLLQNLVSKYADLNLQVFESAGVKEEDLNRIIQNPPPTMSTKQKKILAFSKKLKAEVETAKMQLSQPESEENLMYNQDKQKTADIAKRKKKFKRMGGSDWMPL